METSQLVDKIKNVYIEELTDTETNQASTNTIKFNQNALVQTVSIDYKDAQIQISDYPKSKQSDKAVQSPSSRRKFVDEPLKQEVKSQNKPERKEFQVEHAQDEFVFNYFCPPPLQYNSEKKSENRFYQKNEKPVENVARKESKTSEQIVSKVLNEKIVINQRIEYLKQAVCSEEKLEDEEAEEEEEFWEEPEKEEYFIEKVPQNRANNPLNQFNFDQMPLLKCLFDEMTKLKDMIENTSYPAKYVIIIF